MNMNNDDDNGQMDDLKCMPRRSLLEVAEAKLVRCAMFDMVSQR